MTTDSSPRLTCSVCRRPSVRLACPHARMCARCTLAALDSAEAVLAALASRGTGDRDLGGPAGRSRHRGRWARSWGAR